MSPSTEIIYESVAVDPGKDVAASALIETINAKFVTLEAFPATLSVTSGVTGIIERLPNVDIDFQLAFIDLLDFQLVSQQPLESDIKPKLRYRSPT